MKIPNKPIFPRAGISIARGRQNVYRIQLYLFLLGIIYGGKGLVLGESSLRVRLNTWPQWRGPHPNGTVEGHSWPKKLDSEQLSKMWHKEIGEGYPGPIVSEDRVTA